MTNKKQNRLFSFARKTFYECISPKFKVGSFKSLMNFSYVLFEKIAISFEFLSRNYIDMYKEIVEKEINISDVSSDDSVLIIGCGSIPATSILVSNNSNSKKIVSIDYDLKAVKNAISFINSSSFDKNLKFEHADGMKYPVGNFDVIFVLYGIKKQKDILEYLFYNMKNNSRIIFRTTTDSFTKPLGRKDFLEKYFKIEKSFSSEKLVDTISFFLIKKQ